MRTKITMLVLSLLCLSAYGKDYTMTSPSGQLKVTVTTGDKLTWAIEHNGTTVLQPSAIGMKTSAGNFGENVKVIKVQSKSAKDDFATPFYKKAKVQAEFNSMTLTCKGGYSVTFRAYNEGVAYRFSTAKKAVTVNDETAEFCFADDYKAFVPYVNDNRGGERWCYSFESYYDETRLSDMYKDSLAVSPLAVCLPDGKKAVVMDAGVEDYPGMYLLKGEGNSLRAAFAPYPTDIVIGGYARLNLVPVKRADFIAKTGNTTTEFPWRAVVVTENDSQLLNNDMAQLLAPACRIKDTSWIRPGKVAWDWWNNTNLTGVDFVAGINTPTYKYYIDFAKNNNLEYIIIDEGWSDPESLMILSDEIDLKELVSYADNKGIGIILWSSWRNMLKDMDATMAHYATLGIKGFKVDFFDRDDQEAVRSAYSVAECAAKNHLLLDLHGLKPFGIHRAYPNIMNLEGVKGLENSKWEPRTGDGPLHDQPRYDVSAPYLRMLIGPMDYTPGAMTNATKDNFFGNNDHPMSQGTRVHQMAMYTVFDAPLQMLADSPTKYEKEQVCTDFIAMVPTTFDETVVLGGELGEYIVIARRKGNVWYLAAMTNWTPRDITIDLSRLKGMGTNAEIFADGKNSHREATDYRRTVTKVSSTDKLDIHLAPGGGWTARIYF